MTNKIDSIFAIVAAILLVAAGYHWRADIFGVSENEMTATSQAAAEPDVLYWVAPMDPNFRREGPGKSPMGMDLVPVYAGSASAANDGIQIDPALVASLGVKTAPVIRETLTPAISTVGHIAYDAHATEHVHVRASGWVEKLYVRAIGEYVEAGQPLFEIYAPDLVAAQADYLQSLANDRGSMLDGAKERLVGFGLLDGDIQALRKTKQVQRLLTIRAPRAGVVTKLNTGDGDQITMGQPAMAITATGKVWLMADVFETDMALVRQGANVVVDIVGAAKGLKAKVDYIYTELDMMTRTNPVRIVLDNPEKKLRAGMYADVRIARPAIEDALTVPQSALIRLGKGTRVIVAGGDGHFRPAEVAVGEIVGDRAVILEGVAEGEQVVTAGQFMLDSEASFRGVAARLTAQSDDTEMAEAAFGVAVGTINSVDHDRRILGISHGPIESFGMMGMTMDFPVADHVVIEELYEGARVRFTIKRDGMSFTITGFELVGDNE